jgi:hypothetical protein
MGGQGGTSDTERELSQEQQRQTAIKKQQQEQLRQKSIQALKRKQASFAGSTPTSLNEGGNTTLG